VIPLGIVALATLAANGSRQLRYSAVALLGVSLAANVVTAGQLTVTQLAVEGCGALVALGGLYVAAPGRANDGAVAGALPVRAAGRRG